MSSWILLLRSSGWLIRRALLIEAIETAGEGQFYGFDALFCQARNGAFSLCFSRDLHYFFRCAILIEVPNHCVFPQALPAQSNPFKEVQCGEATTVSRSNI